MAVANPIRSVAKNGQILLTKKLAGKQVQVFEQDDNTFVVKVVTAIPQSELWLYESDNLARIKKSIAWAETTSRRDNFDEIMAKAELVEDE